MTGRTHRVIDHQIVFRSVDANLLAQIDAFLGTGIEQSSSADVADNRDVIYFDIIEDDETGDVTVRSDTVHTFTDRRAALDELPTLLNQYAVWSHDCVTLHAGAVRSPDGEIVLIAGESGSGKSTLTATFVKHGYDYLGDEAIGIRLGTLVAVGYPKPLSIRQSSRGVLGLGDERTDGGGRRWGSTTNVNPVVLRADVHSLSGEVGSISRVLLPTFVDGADLSVELLEPYGAVVALLANTFNLARIGQHGFDTLADLANAVSVYEVVHGSATEFVERFGALSCPSNSDNSSADAGPTGGGWTH